MVDKITYTETSDTTIAISILEIACISHFDPKEKLSALKRAQKLLKEEIKRMEIRIENDSIKTSGQIDLEVAIENEKNKFIPNT